MLRRKLNATTMQAKLRGDAVEITVMEASGDVYSLVWFWKKDISTKTKKKNAEVLGGETK